MIDLHLQAEIVRRRLLQPLADLLVVHVGVNCFQAAAALDLAYIASTVASAVHQATVGPWTYWNLAFGLPVLWFVGRVARHLLRFQARVPRQDFRTVHPFFRRYEVTSYMMLAFVPVAGAASVSVVWSRHHSVERVAWACVDHLSLAVLFLACFLASCEWRRLPPARRRERAPVGGLPEGTT